MVNQGMYGKTTSHCEFLQSCDRPCWACESGDKDSEHQPARNLLYWSEKEILPPYNVVHKDSRSQCEQPSIVIKADMWIVDWCIDCLYSVQVVSPFMGSSLVPCIDPTLFEDLGHSTFAPSLICCPVSDTLLSYEFLSPT